MPSILTPDRAARVLAAVQVDFPKADIEQVHEVFKHGSVEQGIISDDYDDAISDAINEALEIYRAD